MAGSELLLLHSPGCPVRTSQIEGGSTKMARRCVRWKTVSGVRRCAQYTGRSRGGFRGLGGLPGLGQATSLKGTFTDVKKIAIAGGIGAAGVLATDWVFDQITKNVESLAGLTGAKRAAAEAGTGIAIGIIVGKFLKRPRLAANLAIGPVILGIARLIGDLAGIGPFAAGGELSGYSDDLGMMSIEPFQEEAVEGLGAMQVGPGTPSFMIQPDAEVAGVFTS